MQRAPAGLSVTPRPWVLRLAWALAIGGTVAGGESPATDRGPEVQPWRRIKLDPDYSGAWVVAGDLDGDGAVEILSARNVDRNDVHFTSAAVAQDLDGRVLWRWGNPQFGRKKLHHDVACQIYDWDGNGRPLWEVGGDHFESVDVGRICADADGRQLAVDIDHRPWGEGPVWVFDEAGQVRTRITTDYARHHALLDWTGDGVDEILVAQPRALFDGTGRRVATLAMDPRDDADGEERLALTGDFTGDGVPDVLLTTRAITDVYLFKNERGQRPTPPAPLGTGANVTLY